MAREPNVIDDLPAIPASGSAALMKLIERAAMSDTFDVGKLESLLAVKERWEAGEARKAFVVAMTAFKSEAPDLIKNKLVAFGNTRYSHATLDQICDVVGPALAKYGLSHRWEVEQEGDVIRVTTVLTHSLGHSERVTLSAKPDTSGQKNAIQAIGSAISYLQRYGLTAATGLAAKDQDDDGIGSGPRNGNGQNGNGKISPEQKETLVNLMRESGADTKRLLAYFKVETLDALPAAKFADARTMLERKLREKTNG
jgi:hypothetical protein